MDPAWWSADRVLSLETVARVVGRQFPNLHGSAVRKLGEGWDSEVFEVGEEWVVRFPKRGEVQQSLARERALLPELAPRLPIAIPSFELFGAACAEFPYAFVGYRKLPGDPLQACLALPLSASAERAIARQIGNFLGVLHAHAPPFEGVDLPTRRPQLSTEPGLGWRENMAALYELDGALATRVERVFENAPAFDLPHADPVLIHADLDLEHVLIDPVSLRLTAIIDWGDVAVGPAAHDFVGMYGWRGPGFVEQILEHYPGAVTPRDFAWLKLRSLSIALGNVAYGKLVDRTPYVHWGLHTLRVALGDD